jgi:hypothetical protein
MLAACLLFLYTQRQAGVGPGWIASMPLASSVFQTCHGRFSIFCKGLERNEMLCIISYIYHMRQILPTFATETNSDSAATVIQHASMNIRIWTELRAVSPGMAVNSQRVGESDHACSILTSRATWQ